ncbi:RagB/SusD family nutrient uptake outer membrane protein [Pedobacter glucosidilyticus]|uniref:RagB/SusD family nutrient uptake outer membrane protein n=1 Tax=Pedobacter glucosidilyticus TaxID=1122941 RepID=UPI000400E85E|nr:RagB/SusD family nutrient uptake outer membrane protein [Pedobacter glucosidilyticus]
MKNIIKLLTGLSCLLAVISSCKSALDRDPLTEYAYDNYWNEPSQASAALSGAYFRLQSTLNTEFVLYGEARADMLAVPREDNVTNLALLGNRLNPDLAITDWTNFYRVISQANLIVKNVKEMRERGIYANQTTEYNRVLGQALGLRAYCYLLMTKVWGDVPLITEPILNNGDINSFKTPRTEVLKVYTQIATDLLQARDLLPASYTDAKRTRATLTKGGIDAILTDYYMWRNNVDSALIFSRNILDNTAQYRLAALYDPTIDYLSRPQVDIDNTEYAKMFIDGFSQESIFEIEYSFDEGTTSGLLALFAGGDGVAQFVANANFASKFSSTDLRNLTNFRSSVQIFKQFPKGTFDRNTQNDKNVILYRLADIMLLRAEAFIAKGDRNAAWNLLKRIRERTFGPVEIQTPNSNSPTGYVINNPNPNNKFDTGPTGSIEMAAFMALPRNAAIDVILEERQKELCFEGKRWFDLVRTGKAISVMGPINGLNNPENILFPINLNVIRLNPSIEQNNFYK